MQAMGGAGSTCWLCKDPNGIVEQRELTWWIPTCGMPNPKWHGKIIEAFRPNPTEPLVKPKLLQLWKRPNKPSRMRPQALLCGNVSPQPQGPRKTPLILRAPKCSSPPSPSKGDLWITAKSMSP